MWSMQPKIKRKKLERKQKGYKEKTRRKLRCVQCKYTYFYVYIIISNIICIFYQIIQEFLEDRNMNLLPMLSRCTNLSVGFLVNYTVVFFCISIFLFLFLWKGLVVMERYSPLKHHVKESNPKPPENG